MSAVLAGTIAERARSFTARRMTAYDKSFAWRDLSTVILIPTRGMIPIEFLTNVMALALPLNQRCIGFLPEKGMEVAAAYNSLFEQVVDREASERKFGAAVAGEMLGVKFAITLEDDNLPPSDAILQLLGAIHTCPDCGGEVGVGSGGAERGAWVCEDGHKGFDAVSGLYWTKELLSQPLALGDPADPNDFRPRRVREAVEQELVLEVNAIPMGCAVWRKSLFEEVSRPWFQSGENCTQDVYFCKKAKAEVGARFGVSCFTKVGHMDVKTGVIY